ncbi:MAG: hypothetical protein AAFS02_14190 [Pseudomonadota bacterium]
MYSIRRAGLGALSLLVLVLAGCAATPGPEPVTPKVVIVTMFERGADHGDAPGE